MCQSIKKGTEIELEIQDLAYGGQGIAKVDDFVIFVDRALPGQLVRVKIYKKKQHHASARVLELVRESPLTIKPACPHFSSSGCGGCLFQNLAYQKQLEYKNQQVIDTLQHIGGFYNVKFGPALPSDDIFYYRNKMEFSFGERWYPDLSLKPDIDNHDFALGLHIRKFYNKTFDVTDCKLLSPVSNKILSTIRDISRDSGLGSYDSKSKSGFWRFVAIRQTKHTAELMVCIITSDDEPNFDLIDALGEKLLNNHPEITTIVHAISRRSAPVAAGDVQRVLYGTGYIIETLGEYKFQISPKSFFQTNAKQAERLYNSIVQLAEFNADDIVYDLYSGTGTISIYISKLVKKVYGFELVEDAVRDAAVNRKLNRVSNCEFIAGDLRFELKKASEVSSWQEKPSVIITDPPRAGMHLNVVREIIRLAPERIICVSCNPASLARDLKLFNESGYNLDYVQPIDMFPHTPHIEVIARLRKRLIT